MNIVTIFSPQIRRLFVSITIPLWPERMQGEGGWGASLDPYLANEHATEKCQPF